MEEFRIFWLKNKQTQYVLEFTGQSFDTFGSAESWIRNYGDAGVDYVILQVYNNR